MRRARPCPSTRRSAATFFVGLLPLAVVSCFPSALTNGPSGDGSAGSSDASASDAVSSGDLDGAGETCIGCQCPPWARPPRPEVCGDDFDNDCDGLVDEGCLPPPDGCLCIPGSSRWCRVEPGGQVGHQPCLEDGWSWGECEAARHHEACADGGEGLTTEVQECLIDRAECIADAWDRDGDGDTAESHGYCDLVLCDPASRCRSCEPSCDRCFAGERRFCINLRAGGVGVQECGDDLEWDNCVRLMDAIAPCSAVEDSYGAAWEACCIEQGWCCHDMWDLDFDGDTWETFGRCGPGC